MIAKGFSSFFYLCAACVSNFAATYEEEKRHYSGRFKSLFDVDGNEAAKIYSFEILLPDLSRMTKDMNITVPGDVKAQVFNYCKTNNLPVGTCCSLESNIRTTVLPAGSHTLHTQSSASLSDITCSSHAPSLSCRKSGLKIVILHLATAKAHWSASHAQAINLMYTRRHSYDFVSVSCPTALTQQVWDEYTIK